jgi:hypothetical protein
MLIVELSNKIKRAKRILRFAIIFGIGNFGFLITVMLVTTNASSSQIEAAAFVSQKIQDNIADANKRKI